MLGKRVSLLMSFVMAHLSGIHSKRNFLYRNNNKKQKCTWRVKSLSSESLVVIFGKGEGIIPNVIKW